jgi:hypothetical protein
MSVEGLWYQSFSASGEPPHCRRVSRQDFGAQAECAIALAVGFARGSAGYRQTAAGVRRESYWHDGERLYAGTRRSPHDTGWWLVPPRIERAIFALHHAAVECELRRGGRGTCAETYVARRLRKWWSSGHWRNVAAAELRSVFQRPKKLPRKEAARRERVQARIAELRARHPEYQAAASTTRYAVIHWPERGKRGSFALHELSPILQSAVRAAPLQQVWRVHVGTEDRPIAVRREFTAEEERELDCECDNRHRWPSRMGDRCPICGEHWQ